MHTLSIDVTKIPKERLKDGKYLNIVLDKLKETDTYGNTHSVYMSQSKEERTAKAKRIYIGNGKEWNFEKKETPKEAVQEQSKQIQSDNDSGLPF